MLTTPVVTFEVSIKAVSRLRVVTFGVVVMELVVSVVAKRVLGTSVRTSDVVGFEVVAKGSVD